VEEELANKDWLG